MEESKSSSKAQALITTFPLSGWLEIYGKHCRIWITRRPPYCDRGNYQAHVTSEDPLALYLDSADGWPRYYFDFEYMKSELLAWLHRRNEFVTDVFEHHDHDDLYGYVVSFEDGMPRSITCCQCNLTSYNLNDVQHHYCGHCKRFHDLFVFAFEEQRSAVLNFIRDSLKWGNDDEPR